MSTEDILTSITRDNYLMPLLRSIAFAFSILSWNDKFSSDEGVELGVTVDLSVGEAADVETASWFKTASAVVC